MNGFSRTWNDLIICKIHAEFWFRLHLCKFIKSMYKMLSMLNIHRFFLNKRKIFRISVVSERVSLEFKQKIWQRKSMLFIFEQANSIVESRCYDSNSDLRLSIKWKVWIVIIQCKFLRINRVIIDQNVPFHFAFCCHYRSRHLSMDISYWWTISI